MALVIGSNLFATIVSRELSSTRKQLRTAYSQVSTGSDLGIDGERGGRLALAETLRSQTRVATVAIRNANDGLAYVNTADAGLEAIQSVLIRMAELADQAANGTFTTAQRSALQSEFTALGSEVNRISGASTYNSFNTLSSSSHLSIQVGLNGGSDSLIEISPVEATLEKIGIGAASGALTYSISDTTSDGAVSASRLAYSAILTAQDTLAIKRGSVTAISSRLSSAVNQLTVLRENFSAAESNIRDADMATSIANLTRLQVLQESQVALLAQANQIPSLVMKLFE